MRLPPVQAVAESVANASPAPEWLRVLGMILASGLVTLAVLAGPVRRRAAAMLGALVVSPLLLLTEIWESPQLAALRDRPSVAIGALVAGAVVVGVLSVVFARRPAAFALAAIAALPFRVPIEVGGSTANLLVPLYAVVAAGALGWLVPRLREEAPEEPPPRGALEWLLLGSLVLYAVQSAYSSDPGKALSQVVFFYVPFGILFALLRRLEWTPRLIARCFGVLLVLAVVFVAIGYVEFFTRQVFFNPKVIASNQAQEYFRVNSLFFDPSIYGRFLVVVMLGLTSLLVWSPRPRNVLGATAGLVVLAGGLLLTLSQSSFAALLAGLTTIALLRWRARWTLLGVALAATVAAVLVLAAPGLVGLNNVSGPEALNRASSGRVNLISGGLELAREKTVLGWGSGSFEREYRRLKKSTSARATAASHTIPVTVAAEQGLIGLAVYLTLLGAALLRLLRGARRHPARAALAAAFVALSAHTWMYAAFLEDPTTWALLAVGAALAPVRPRPDAAAEDAADGGRRAGRRDRAARPGAVPAATSPPEL